MKFKKINILQNVCCVGISALIIFGDYGVLLILIPSFTKIIF